VRAVEAGAAAIIVSNHGGRNLDSSPATLEVLPEVAEAVSARAEVLMDGGVRRGTDVIKALSLGARAVLVGRPVLWGLAVDGQSGVEQVLRGLRRDLEESMTMLGCPNVAQLSPDYLRQAH
jgi:isopentenyl diphosphate isomerase/L-lactate dehydrogenase-like FMN-dependent dehydrogenase